MNKKKIILLLISLTLFSCQKKISKEILESETEIIKINVNDDLKQESTFGQNSVVQEVSYIRLETNKEANISKVDRLIAHGDYYFILDKLSNGVFVFSKDGKFVNKVSSVGEGLGKYKHIYNFTIDQKNNNIVIYDDRTKKIIEYKPTGEFEKETRIDFVFNDFAYTGSGVLCFDRGFLPSQEANPTSLIVKKEDKILSQKFPFLSNGLLYRLPYPKSSFSSFADSTSFVRFYSNLIYRVNNDGTLKQRYFIDFGTSAFPFSYELRDREIQELRKDTKITLLKSILETPSILNIQYIKKSGIYSILYFKDTHNKFHIPNFWFYTRDLIQLPDIAATDGEDFLGIWDAYTFKKVYMPNYSKNKLPIPEKIKTLNDSLNELDNPIIVRIKIKKL